MGVFDTCPFKVAVYSYDIKDNASSFKCAFQYKSMKAPEAILKHFEIYSKKGLSPIISEINYIIPQKQNSKFMFSIKTHKSNVLRNNLCLVFYLSNKKVYYVTFEFGESFKAVSVTVRNMDYKEIRDFERILSISKSRDTNVSNNKSLTKDTSAPLTKIEFKQYLDGLNNEIKYIKSTGGHSYKATNGMFTGSDRGKYTYTFDLESEVYMSDETPVKANIGIQNIAGVIVLCEEFHMVIDLNEYVGEKVNVAYISVENWKLLEAMIDRVSFGVISKSQIMDLLINKGPQYATYKDIKDIPQGQQKVIDHYKENPITIVWGPPGTGKTHTMSQITINSFREGKSVLIVSHSNVSVDGVILKIKQLLMENDKSILKKGMFLRYGYVRNEQLKNDSEINSFAYALSKQPRLKEELDKLQQEYNKLKHSSGMYSLRMKDIRKKIQKIHSDVKNEEIKSVEKARVVVTTISKVIIDKIFLYRQFDVVMFDEISMAYVPQVACAATFAKEHFLCVGDFLQLPPIVQSPEAEILKKDLFYFLGISDGGKMFYHPWLFMLNTQRRMHPQISVFPNKFMYKNMLKDNEGIAEKLNDIVEKELFCGTPLNLINLQGTYCVSGKNSDNSRFNILSAIISFSCALITEENVDSVSVITPYAAQSRLIRALVIDYRNKKYNSNIKCSTVHQFQGSESDVVLFDTVESFPSKKPGYLMSKELTSVKRLVNVAITRARGKLIVVSNKLFWEFCYKDKDIKHTLYRLLDYIETNGFNVRHSNERNLEKTIEKLSIRGGPKYFLDSSYIKDYIKDIKNAKDKIIISLPSGLLSDDIQDLLFKNLKEKSDSGITVLVKTNDYQNLNDKWKEITWGTENANYPITIIDKQYVWYGAPFADWQFEFKDGKKLKTVCKIACRLSGEHAVEMIKSLTEIELRDINGIKSPLFEKNGYMIDEKVVNHSGIKQHIKQLYTCPLCGNGMDMTKGKSGKIIAWCKACKKTELISPDDINAYISENDVTCPIHKCFIEARVGKFGLYVQCEMGHQISAESI